MGSMEGTRLGAYRIERELGSGGMGKVYLAEVAGKAPGLDAGIRVALKVIHRHLLEAPGFFKRFLREAEIGKAVSHPNVVRTYDVDALVLEGRQHNFLVMEYVSGQTLRELLGEMETVPEELCRHIGREVSRGLAAIHAAGVVHRDLKPENVLISPEHEVKIMDLGVARLADEAIRLSQTGAFVGSVHYAAPEQFRGGGKEVDGRADLHALGLILYELASGVHPYLADDVPKVLRRILDESPRRLSELNPQLSPFFEEAVHQLLAKDRADRFASANDLLRILEEGERSTWWGRRARAIRAETKRPLRRIRIPRETAVYGREEELEQLRRRYEKAADGEGQVVLVEGEAGIGKTRLVDELVGRLQRDGEDLSFLFGSYPPGGAATAAGAWSTAYREHFGAEGLAESLGEYLAATPALIPAFAALLRGEPAPAGEAALTKDSIQTVFANVTKALAKERTTVVLIEDLHFAPEEGLALFAALSHVIPEHRVLLLGTARSLLADEWRADLDRLDHAGRLALARLGPKDLAKLLEDAFRSERLATELGHRIALKSDGNPFFVFEIIRVLREGDYIARRPDGSWATTRVIREIEIPSTVQDLIQARIAGLTEEEQELLDVASCCGFRFDPDLVAEVVGLGSIPVLRRFGHLERAHRLLCSAGRDFVFDHHQVQEALYAGLNERLRERYHAAIAEALEARHPEPDGETAVELCEHYLSGGEGERALDHLGAALGYLEGSLLNGPAGKLAAAALAIQGLVRGGERVRLLLRLSRFLWFTRLPHADRDALDEALELADALDDPALRGLVRDHLGYYLTGRGESRRAVSMLREAVALCREGGRKHEEASACRHLAGALYDVGEIDEAGDYCRRAVALAREAGDLAAEGGARNVLGGHLKKQGRLREALEEWEEAERLNLGAGELFEAQKPKLNSAVLLGQLGDAERSRRLLMEVHEVFTRAGYVVSYIESVLGVLAANEGEWEEALRLQTRALETRRMSSIPVGTAVSLLRLARIHLAGGRFEEAEACLEEARGGSAKMAMPDLETIAALELAVLRGEDPAGAVALFEAHEPRLTVFPRMEARFLLWKATRVPTHLEEAYRLLCLLRDHAPEQTRETMIRNVPLHRDIVATRESRGN
jgi:tetratricopeptide (TPR) repeat protein